MLARLQDLARRRPAQPALRQGALALTFDQLAIEIESLAQAARKAGIASGDVVAVVADSSPRAVAATLGVHGAGAVPLLLGGDAKAPAPATWLLAARHGDPVFTRTGGAAPLPAPPTLLTLPAGTTWLRQTGGTTSTPRLVAFADDQVRAAADIAQEFMQLQEGDEVVATVPAAHGYGWNTAGFGPLLAGAATTFLPPLDPRGFLERLAQPHVRWGVTTAPVIRALARLASSGPPATRSLAPALVAAAAYPVAEAQRVATHFGLRVLDRFGVTEAGPVAQAKEPHGPLFASRSLRLREAGNPPVLEVAGPSVALGYVGDPSEVAAPFAGRFRTADRIAFDPGGGFRVLGRTDRVIRRAGRALDLLRIERLLCTLPAVERARVRAVPAAMDVDLVAEIVPMVGASVNGEEVLAALAASLEAWERPSRIEVRNDAPADGAEKWTARPG